MMSAPDAPVPAMPPAVSLAAANTRDLARARRTALAQQGRGNTLPTPPSRPPRQETPDYVPKVTASETQAGRHVTGLRIGQGGQVTGDARGAAMPVSGTQYLGVEQSAGWRAGGPKVGLARTEAGLVVSGTLVRSRVRITGDEAGQGVAITGEADQRPDDDLTRRADHGSTSTAQFQRRANPHGASVFGANAGRSMRMAGSRERSRAPVIEVTESGQPITGPALGRSGRVTGDENGACRPITGSQYLAPARRQAACGFVGGGTAPAEHIGAARPDPVTADKVTVAQSWGGQRVTGPDVEYNPRVTGDAPGACALLTGSQYQGPLTAQRWCDPAEGERAAAQMARRAAEAPVTGDAPVNAAAVTGTARGAACEITGTPYYRAEAEAAAPGDVVAEIDRRFSIRSPQRAAQLRAARSAAEAPGSVERITGSFAVGGGKVTGNLEFLARPRFAAPGERPPAHARLSGEGGSQSGRVTGDAWAEQPRVTGTEDAFAARNPSEGGGTPRAFAGSAAFKSRAVREEAKQLVTGMFGYFSKTGARVTLSGGAQS